MTAPTKRPALATLVAHALLLSSLAIAAALSAGALRPVTISGLDLHRTLLAVWPAGRRLTGPAPGSLHSRRPVLPAHPDSGATLTPRRLTRAAGDIAP
ncbi:MAG: hypothetical protein WAM30_20550 [Candidatus Dormiibacterota bacterium]